MRYMANPEIFLVPIHGLKYGLKAGYAEGISQQRQLRMLSLEEAKGWSFLAQNSLEWQTAVVCFHCVLRNKLMHIFVSKED